MNIDCSLYLVAGEEFLQGMALTKAIEEAILGGVSIVQLREKRESGRRFYEKAFEVKKVTSKYNVPLIINDRLDIALAVDAEGVHLGQNDIPIHEARKIMGNKIIGATVRSPEEAVKAKHEGASYLGAGAVYTTSSKNDVSRIIKIEGLKEIAASTSIPKVGIGGITSENIKNVLETGVEGIAVISAILRSKDIRSAAADLRSIVDKYKRTCNPFVQIKDKSMV